MPARAELETFVSVYGFPVEVCFYSSIGIPGCLGFQKCDRSVCWLMELRWEYNSERCSRAIQIYLYHHLGGWGACGV